MNKNLIKKEYVIQSFDKDNNDWHDYEKYDTRYHKKASVLKTIERLNAYQDGKYRLIVCKSFLVLDGVKNEAVQETPKTITFGKWKKPLTWTVIDEDDEKMLLLCDTCVEFMRFDGNSNNYTFSEIRSWLNNKDETYNTSKEDYTNIGFLNAFTDEEINRLERFNGAPWNDYVGLLSCEKYEKFKEKIPKIGCYWWLRSPGDDTYGAAGVDYDGYVDDYGDTVDYDDLGVRPALWLKK